jgi:hypothetical protein
MFCFGVGILVGLIAHYKDYKRNELPGDERPDIPMTVLGGLIVVVLVAVAGTMIILAFTPS